MLRLLRRRAPEGQGAGVGFMEHPVQAYMAAANGSDGEAVAKGVVDRMRSVPPGGKYWIIGTKHHETILSTRFGQDTDSPFARDGAMERISWSAARTG